MSRQTYSPFRWVRCLSLSPAVVLIVLLSGAANIDRVGEAIAQQQTAGPTMLDPTLQVRIDSTDLVTPTSIAFIGSAGMFVLEKDTGKVQRVLNGRVHSTALDLAVNAASERGLLGIALHPDFPSNPGVYLFWTCRASIGQDNNPFRPKNASVPIRRRWVPTPTTCSMSRCSAIASIASSGMARPSPSIAT